MHTMLRTSAAILAMLATSGCSVWSLKYGRDKPQFSYVLPDQGQGAPGSIYLWNPNTTVAYVANDGKVCILPADVFKALNVDVEAGLKAGALQGIENLDASTKAKIVDQVTRLSEKDAAGTFLSVALFNICIVANNQHLTNEQVIELVNKSLESAGRVAGAGKPTPPAAGGTTP